ncbi:TRAP transporter large permease [Rubrimonas cliftonensis]|uniref:TRAP transporter large permease protein n=1 Tax=Rubrimonas cliftonensis TaxID=89524 RepID=A0A1H4CIC4_9RHOB|nr:TRAP transporter large permease [Rubrimonas cliftonensis]SEA60079.1 C4-dicarboxylate transporter, DctM subunit [Rubrimonas cliftonensis]
MEVVLILLALFSLLLVGVPVAFALGGLGLGLLLVGGFAPSMASTGLLSALDSFILLAIPLFLLMSNILLRGGVGRDLFAAVQAWVGHWPGGLAVATVLSCGLFAAISGSSVATAGTIGSVAIPEMTRRGYPRPFVFGLLAAGGTLGILIPPSIILIVYGVITESSILALFMAGVGPGLLMMALFIVYAMLYAKFSSDYTPSPRAAKGERRRTGLRALPTAALAGLVIAGIYQGWFTPTEAAAIGFIGALFLTVVVLRSLSWADLKAAVADSMRSSASILLIVAGAKVFGKAIALWRVPQDLSAFITANVDTAGAFIIAVALALLVMGLFMEALSMMLIMMPVLAGTMAALGVDPIWFGIFFIIMVECALITPPVGLNLYVIQSIGRAQMGEVARGAAPFVLLMLLTVILIYLFEDIALWLPRNL